MPKAAGDKAKAAPKKTKPVQQHDEDRLEDEEKILAGRDDVNYPAMLTKDVPGG